MRLGRISKRMRTPMFLIDSHGKRPVCVACDRLGPYQEAEPGVFICDVCVKAADARLRRFAETVPELRDHRLAAGVRLRAMSAAREPGSIRGLYNVYGKSEQKVYGKSEQGEAENYARMPESVLFDDALSVTARCVYGVLARYVYQGTTVKIGQRRIAGLLGVHVETVNVAIHELEGRQHIAIRGTGRARRIYHLSSSVFGQKQRAGSVQEVISSPSRTRRFASVRRA